MERVVPWAVLVQIVAPYYVKVKTGRPPFGIETMLRIHYLKQWFGPSDPAMDRHLPEKHDLAVDMLRAVSDLLQHKGLMLRSGTAVDATLISAPSSTKNADDEYDPEMKPTKKGNNWYFGMKAQIGVDAHSGPVHTAYFMSSARYRIYSLIEQADTILSLILGPLRATRKPPRRAGREEQTQKRLLRAGEQGYEERPSGFSAHVALREP